jgi:serine/threonine protein kinase/formylglycine-generating enzyme required for sulfatase activity
MTLVSSSGGLAMMGGTWSPPEAFDEFRIVRSLGLGSMGQVYLAHDELLERQVAVKFVHPGTDPVARARLIEEARAIARLQHPNVVAIYRVAEFDGHPYLVSEYVQGRALNQLERPMRSRQVLDIALDLARGLAAAHRRGVLHRDIKPANAILTDDGRAKLLDFGLAMIVGSTEDSAPALTAHGTGQHPPIAGPDETPVIGEHTLRARAAIGSPGGANGTSSPDSDHHQYMVGTPMYMAPEVWRGEPATRRSDLYSLGVLLYELLAGKAPYRDVPIHELPNVVQQRDIPRLGEIAPAVDPALAAIVDRLVERDPRDRFRSAEALLVALEECAAPPRPVTTPDGNPYRGLAVFESEHAALFFGRRGEGREVVDRVRIEPLVVVGGDSGTGKSSLCRAWVLPWLADNDGWSSIELVPGRHPVRALAVALAPWTGSDEAALAELLRDNPDAVARAIRQQLAEATPLPDGEMAPRLRRRLVLFVDQLEELLTMSELAEARLVAGALAALAVRSPSVRVLATARSDFLSRLAMLPGLGDEIAHALYFLRPLTGEHVREVIVRPAAAKGVVFETDALIDTLIAQTEHAPGGLPLLQFTLAELWDARDIDARMIRAESLTALGGVGGALTRHADRLLAGLNTDERDAARRIVLRLVTVEGTRLRRSKAELLTDGPAGDTAVAERTALEALVRGRVLVANNAQDGAYEIAHEALVTSWPTLQAWRQRDAVNHAIQERIEQAAASWQRMNRARELLWGRRQLLEARALDGAGLPARETAFLAASARAIRRRRLLGAGVAAVLALGGVAVGLAIRAKARRDLEAMTTEQVRAATTGQLLARQIARQVDDARSRAFAMFDSHQWRAGEAAWNDVEAQMLHEEREYRTASAHLDSVLLLDPARAGLRDWAADLAFERLVRADRNRRRDLSDELASRLSAYDDGRYQTALAAQAAIALTVEPPGTRVWLEHARAPRQLIGETPLPALTLPPGSLVLSFEAAGRAPARLPALLTHGERLEAKIALPALASAPPGMVYVPPGRFLFGSAADSDGRRGFLNTVPLHEVSTPGYFIGRHEVTFGEWIDFLDDLPPAQRRQHSPQLSTQSTFMLSELAPRRWRLTMTPATETYSAETGQLIHYKGRERRADQNWMRFPVSAVSYESANAYAAWLDRTGRIPGARLCDEYEWERAARGADGRTYPSGEVLAPDDANIDATYGRVTVAFGPDEVGSHPGSRSPVGADDLAGNVWEWTSSVQTSGAPSVRGGGWYTADTSARSMNREYGDATEHHSIVGVRLCATPR